MTVEIKTATSKDLAGILNVNGCFDKPGDTSNPSKFFEDQLKLNQILIAETNDRIVGYLTYQMIWGNAPFMALLKIIPDYQKQGVGTKLVQELEKILVRAGYDLLISSSESTNTGGITFHQKIGFKPIGNWSSDIIDDEIFFQKNLEKR